VQREAGRRRRSANIDDEERATGSLVRGRGGALALVVRDGMVRRLASLEQASRARGVGFFSLADARLTARRHRRSAGGSCDGGDGSRRKTDVE